MAADLQAIIDHIADTADDFLEGASNRAQALAGIEELLTADYHPLSPADRKAVLIGVIAILEKEGFFEGTAGETSPEDDASEGEA